MMQSSTSFYSCRLWTLGEPTAIPESLKINCAVCVQLYSPPTQVWKHTIIYKIGKIRKGKIPTQPEDGQPSVPPSDLRSHLPWPLSFVYWSFLRFFLVIEIKGRVRVLSPNRQIGHTNVTKWRFCNKNCYSRNKNDLAMSKKSITDTQVGFYSKGVQGVRFVLNVGAKRNAVGAHLT